MRLAWTFVIAAGCYAPVPATGVPCASNGDCPAPLVCDHARAEPTCEKAVSDAAPADVSAIDAPPDTAFQGDAPIDGAIDAALPCLLDDFNDGNATGWTIIDPAWTVRSNEGPDSSFAFLATNTTGNQIITHPGMLGVTMARLALDFRIDNGAAGDFDIYLVPPGWTDPNGPTQARYFIAIYVLGGDSGPNDRIVRVQPPVAGVELATHVVGVTADIWHHLEMQYLPNGSMRIDLDGSLYMMSPPDSTLPAPLDLLIRFWAHGAIDNVRLDCVH